jgi:hypothetical protein
VFYESAVVGCCTLDLVYVQFLHTVSAMVYHMEESGQNRKSDKKNPVANSRDFSSKLLHMKTYN